MQFMRAFNPFHSESAILVSLASLVGLSVALCMVAFEVLKQWLHPDISPWESHVLTIAFSGSIALVASYFLIRRQHALHRELLSEARELRHAHESVRMLAQTVRSVSEAVSVTDMSDQVIFVNDAFLKTYLFASEGDIVGRNISIVRSAAEHSHDVQSILPDTIAGGWRGELTNTRQDGTDFQIYLSTSVVRDEQGQPVALVGVARDITEQKRTEESLRQAQRLESIATLAGGVAHDFNNLLQGILGHTTLAQDSLDATSPAREDLQVVLNSADRAAELTRQLMAYAGHSQIRARGVDLNRIVADRLGHLHTLVPKTVSLRTEIGTGLPTIEADPHQLQQVLSILMANAAEAIGERPGTIALRTSARDIPAEDLQDWQVAGDSMAPGLFVIIDVEDDGCGMDQSVLSRIYEPFFSTKFPGRGLGLAAVHGIVRSHGGGVQVHTAVGRGTRFLVAIPAAPSC